VGVLYELCIQKKSFVRICGGKAGWILFLLLDVAAGLALEAGAADDGDVGSHFIVGKESGEGVSS
jgi:hypothetical protein